MTKPIDDKENIAIINTNIGYIQRDILDIKTVLKEGYATKESLAEVARDTERRLTILESQNTLLKWASPLFSAVLGSVMTFLVIQYLVNVKGTL